MGSLGEETAGVAGFEGLSAGVGRLRAAGGDGMTGGFSGVGAGTGEVSGEALSVGFGWLMVEFELSWPGDFGTLGGSKPPGCGLASLPREGAVESAVNGPGDGEDGAVLKTGAGLGLPPRFSPDGFAGPSGLCGTLLDLSGGGAGGGTLAEPAALGTVVKTGDGLSTAAPGVADLMPAPVAAAGPGGRGRGISVDGADDTGGLVLGAGGETLIVSGSAVGFAGADGATDGATTSLLTGSGLGGGGICPVGTGSGGAA